MVPGYTAVHKDRIIRSDDIVAILTKKSKRNRSKIVSVRDTYYSRTSPRRLAERLEGEKEKKGHFKKRG